MEPPSISVRATLVLSSKISGARPLQISAVTSAQRSPSSLRCVFTWLNKLGQHSTSHQSQCRLQHQYEFRSANFSVRLLLQPGWKEISPNPTDPRESWNFAAFPNAISSPPSTKASLCVFHPKFPSLLALSQVFPQLPNKAHHVPKLGTPICSSLSIPFK